MCTFHPTHILTEVRWSQAHFVVPSVAKSVFGTGEPVLRDARALVMGMLTWEGFELDIVAINPREEVAAANQKSRIYISGSCSHFL